MRQKNSIYRYCEDPLKYLLHIPIWCQDWQFSFLSQSILFKAVLFLFVWHHHCKDTFISPKTTKPFPRQLPNSQLTPPHTAPRPPHSTTSHHTPMHPHKHTPAIPDHFLCPTSVLIFVAHSC